MGLCGRAARMSDCGLLSCALIERVNKGRNPPKRGMAGRETSIPKGSVSHCRSGIHRAFSHIAHKRRNVRFKGLRRVHTPPQPLTAHTAAHTAKHGGYLSIGHSVALCCQRNCHRKNSRRKWMHALWRVSAFTGVAAPLGCAAWTLLFPQPRAFQPCCVCAYSFITGPCRCSGSSRNCCA